MFYKNVTIPLVDSQERLSFVNEDDFSWELFTAEKFLQLVLEMQLANRTLQTYSMIHVEKS
jgi:hypothetical protein